MISSELLDAYKYHRSHSGRYGQGGHGAVEALKRARFDVANGSRKYCSQWSWQKQFNINPEWSGYGHERLRFIENPAALPWREVGTCYDIDRKEGWHSPRDSFPVGWYINDFQETTSGVVYRLPARHGKPQFLAGYTDPHNSGAVTLSFDTIYTDLKQACRTADKLAETMAEQEREYNEAWEAGREFTDLAEEVTKTRAQVKTIIGELKALRKYATECPAICATLREGVSRKLAEIAAARKKRAELQSSWGRHEGFIEGTR